MHLQTGIAKGACAHFGRCPAHRPAVKRPAMPRPAAPSPRCQPMHAGIAPNLCTPADIDSGTAGPAHSPCTAHSRARAPQRAALLPRCPCCLPLQLLPPHPPETQSAARSAARLGTGRMHSLTGQHTGRAAAAAGVYAELEASLTRPRLRTTQKGLSRRVCLGALLPTGSHAQTAGWACNTRTPFVA